MGSTYSLYSHTMVNDYGYASSLSSFSEMIYFTSIDSGYLTFSFDYSGRDDGLNPGLDSNNYSASGISYNIANFNDGIYWGLGAWIQDAINISLGTLTTTMHFDQGETGWFALCASAGSALYIPNSAAPVPEPSTVLLLGIGLVGLAWHGLKRKKA